MRSFKFVLAALYLLINSSIITANSPIITRVTDSEHGASLEALSDNGNWAVGYGKSVISETNYSFPILYDVVNGVMVKLYTEQEGETIGRMMACDVSDDGELIAGQYDGKPAIYHRSTSTWETLPFDSKTWEGGECSQITPDGKYGLGTLEARERVFATVAYWDFTGETPIAVELTNLPKPISLDGVLNENYQQIYATELSPDGRSFTGLVMFSFAGETWSFIYNVDSQSWMAFGYDIDEIDDKHYNFSRKTYEGYSISGGQFLHDGSNLYVGSTRGKGNTSYYLDPTDFSITFNENNGGWYGNMDNNGTFYGSEEVSYTARNWRFRTGEYWYDFREVCRQVWDIDWQNDITKDDYGLSGTFIAVSDDGLVVLANDYSNSPYDSFVIQFAEPLCEVAPLVDLLGNYSVTPANNASFGILKEIKVKFDREIDILGEYNSVKLVDEDGDVIASSISLGYFVDDNQTMLATFRNHRLESGKNYFVVFPDGSVCVNGDPERKNSEIRLTYTGRPSAPVTPVNVAPEDGSSIMTINASSNPVAVTFDASITPVENNAGSMVLYQLNDNNEREEICKLSGSVSDNILSIYPVLEQHLAKGSTYEVVIEANTFSDISGADPNEELVITYHGSYVPDKSIGAVVFSDNFNDGLSTTNWMLYDGDQLTPNTEMEGWGFTESLPWWLARDNVGDTDMCAVSHSMYSTPGKSDDWLVTKQLYISDSTYMLSFKAQSYHNGCDDKLKVYVYATDDIYIALTPSIIDKMRNSGDIVFEETLSPGTYEDKLADDWEEYVINLDKYEGLNIYIAFVNDNNNESAIFVDDVIVSRDVKISFTNLTPQSVLAADDVEVSGILSVESKTESYKGYTINLLDADGNIVSTLTNPDEVMDEGWSLEFTMPERLATPIGKITDYVIDITIGELNESAEESIMNLALPTTKKVVIEEYTGQTCPNCPLGHAALEWIEQDFPGLVIPLSIHTYTGDSFATPQAALLQEGLGLNAAPTGRVDRLPISSPMYISNDGEYFYKNNGLWYDYVVTQLSSLTPADIDIVSVDFDGEKYTVDVEVRYSLDMDNLNINLLTVVCENGLQGVQENNRYNEESAALREWGLGGEYGQYVIPFVFDDVVRTWAGTTYNGTGGFIPSSVEGGKTYTATVTVPNISRINNNDNTTVTVMLIDAETGIVINADRKGVYYNSGVQNIKEDFYDLSIKTSDGKIFIFGTSSLEADLFRADGRKIAYGKGENVLCVDTNGYHGIVFAVVRTLNGIKTVKLLL